mgnify:CR=1 FL=1
MKRPRVPTLVPCRTPGLLTLATGVGRYSNPKELSFSFSPDIVQLAELIRVLAAIQYRAECLA